MVTAQIKMKALVVSRLMLGDIPDWRTFEDERKTASDIAELRGAFHRKLGAITVTYQRRRRSSLKRTLRTRNITTSPVFVTK